MIEIISVGSSSSGNSYIILADGCNIILDAGLPAKRITGALEDLGIGPEEVDAVLITHEHSDHVKSVRAVARKCCDAVICVSRGTAENAACFEHVPEERIHYMEAGDSLPAGPEDSVVISAFSLSHDATEPLGFTVSTEDEKLAVVTDTGIITEEIFDAVKDADKLVLEANHDEQMLLYGEYPYYLKVRIKGEEGHLSNAHAGGMLARMLEERREWPCSRPLRVMLAHLSFHNNAPIFARQTVEDILRGRGFRKDVDYTLDVAAKEGLTFMPHAADFPEPPKKETDF